MTRLLLTVPEAAESLAISRSKVYELIAAGLIRSVRIDGSRRVPACRGRWSRTARSWKPPHSTSKSTVLIARMSQLFISCDGGQGVGAGAPLAAG